MLLFGGEDESQPSTSNCNELPTKILEGCGAVNHASVPKKLRSAIKKRGREYTTPPLPVRSKRKHIQNGVNTHRKDGTKKSKLKTGHISKDEEEVADTLYALAGMFSDQKRTDQSAFDHEQPETKSSATPEEASLIDAAEGEKSSQISSKATPMAAPDSSNLMDSTARILKSKSLGELEVFSNNELPITNACGVQSDLNLCSRPPASIIGMAPRGGWVIDLEQVGPSGVQYGKNCNPIDDKCKDTLLSPKSSATRNPCSETQRSCPRLTGTRLPAGFESTNISTQPCGIENRITTVKYTGVAIESKKSWKRCTAHVYISRLIKVLQISDVKEGLPLEKPAQSAPCGGAEQQPHNQTTVINCRNDSSAQTYSSEIQNDILFHKMPVQDQKRASQTSASHPTKQGYDFLSLGTGLDTGDSIDGDGHSNGPRKQYHMPSFMQSQDHSAMLFPLPQNGCSSSFYSHSPALTAQQVQQLPQYHSSTENSSFTAQSGQQMEPHQHKWASQLHAQHNTVGCGGPLFPDWKNSGRDTASVLNYAHSLFPHAALGPKYQQFSPSHEQVLVLNTPLPLANMNRHHIHLPLGFERNGAVFRPENMKQLQLPCNQHL